MPTDASFVALPMVYESSFVLFQVLLELKRIRRFHSPKAGHGPAPLNSRCLSELEIGDGTEEYHKSNPFGGFLFIPPSIFANGVAATSLSTTSLPLALTRRLDGVHRGSFSVIHTSVRDVSQAGGQNKA